MADSDNAQLYRLARAAEVPDDAWSGRLTWTQCYRGTKGLDDKFIHLSTAQQVGGTAEAFFAGAADLLLLSFSAERLIEEADLKIKYEAVEGAEGLYPHAYGGWLPYACLTAPPAKLELGEDGKHVLPPLGPRLAAGVEKADGDIMSDKHSSDDDGLEPFNQHMYDLDDDGNDALDPS